MFASIIHLIKSSCAAHPEVVAILAVGLCICYGLEQIHRELLILNGH